MEPLTSVFSPKDGLYSDAVTAQTVINMARQQGYEDWANNVESSIKNIRANSNPSTYRRDAAMLQRAFQEVDDFSKNYIQPQIGKEKDQDGWGQMEVDPATGRMFQRSLKNPQSLKYHTPQMGFEMVTNPGGGTTLRQVEVGGKKQEMEPEKVKDIDFTKSVGLVQAFDDALQPLAKVPSSTGTFGALARKAQAVVPGSPAYDFGVAKQALDGKALLTMMMELKKASASGSTGFGQFTEKEAERVISDVLGGIDLGVSDPKVIGDRLNRAKKRLLDMNYGSRAYRIKLLEEGKIDGASFGQIESLYDGSYANFMKQQEAGNGGKPAQTQSIDPSQLENMNLDEIITVLEKYKRELEQ